jgi:hypothetical protein
VSFSAFDTHQQVLPMSEIPSVTGIMETIKNTISENLGGPAHALASPENSFSLEEVPDLSGKVHTYLKL